MGAIKAIDVSVWQGNINFNKVKAAGVKAVIIRSGYLGKTDAFLTGMYRAHKRQGLT